MTLCSVPDCDRPADAKGMCNMHYQRHIRLGSRNDKPHAGGRPRKYTGTAAERNAQAARDYRKRFMAS